MYCTTRFPGWIYYTFKICILLLLDLLLIRLKISRWESLWRIRHTTSNPSESYSTTDLYPKYHHISKKGHTNFERCSTGQYVCSFESFHHWNFSQSQDSWWQFWRQSRCFQKHFSLTHRKYTLLMSCFGYLECTFVGKLSNTKSNMTKLVFEAWFARSNLLQGLPGLMLTYRNSRAGIFLELHSQFFVQDIDLASINWEKKNIESSDKKQNITVTSKNDLHHTSSPM